MASGTHLQLLLHLKLAIQPAFVLDISLEWDRKIEAIRAYHSQFIEGRTTQFLDQLRDEASHWGRVIGTRYGEPYACREPLGLRGLGLLQ